MRGSKKPSKTNSKNNKTNKTNPGATMPPPPTVRTGTRFKRKWWEKYLCKIFFEF